MSLPSTLYRGALRQSAKELELESLIATNGIEREVPRKFRQHGMSRLNNVSELLSGVLTTWLPVSHSTSRQLGLSRYKGGCKKSSVAPKRLLAAFAFVQLQSRVPWVPELGLHSVRIQLLGRSRQLFQCSR